MATLDHPDKADVLPAPTDDSNETATSTVATTTEPSKGTVETEGDQPATDKQAIDPTPTDVATQPDQPVAKRSSSETLEFLKNATVFIKVTTTEGEQTGSGFLVERGAGKGFIVSNAHVVEPFKGTLRSVECIFRSSRPDEFKVSAAVVGKDSARDLAILSINHDDLPEPLGAMSEVDVHETLSVLVLGFPFGEVLTTSSRNPAITVARCAISSIRRDDYDNVSFLQVDGGINPGNSGGPVVTEDGRLVGVAVAKLMGTEIGLAIPQKSLRLALAGRITSITLKEITKDSRSRVYNAKPTVIDPRNNIQSASILTCTASELKDKKPGPNGVWSRVAKEMTETPLDLRNGSLVIVPNDLKDWVWQVEWTLKDGTKKLTEPVKYGSPTQVQLASRGTEQPRRPTPGGPRPRQPPPDLKGQPDESPLPAVPGNIDVVQLPSMMADFAMNPITGDVAAVDPVAHRAHLFRAAEGLSGGSEAGSVRLGDTPIAITFKRFEDQELFAAVCTQDSHMYVIDANSFTLLRKIPLASAGISSVTCSSNSQDPFVYYNYGSGHGSSAGVVDLRKMVDRGLAFGDSMDCAISADGRVAYRRGPWSPSGFESLLMTSDFSEEKPIFASLYREHRSTGGYVPDPAGAFTASGTAVHTRQLEKLVANLSFTPSCFFTSRPVIVGMAGKELVAASYNTLSSIGKRLQLPSAVLGLAGALPRGVRSQADFKRVGFKVRILADDQNSRVIYAFRNRVALIPLSELDLPDEPFMTLEQTVADLVVGKKSSIVIASRDSRVSVVPGDLPEGATKTESGMDWKPTDAQVGTFALPVTLAFGEIHRVVNVELRVAQPSVRAPFAIAGVFIDQAAERAVCWTGPGLDRHGRPIRSGSENVAVQHRIAVLSLHGGDDVIEKQLTYPVRKAIAINSYIAVLRADENFRVEVFEASTLKRIKTLLSTEPLIDISGVKNELMLHGQSAIDVYDLESFKKLRTIGSSSSNGSASVANTGFKDGLLVDGVLYDSTGDKPILMIAPNRFITLKGADNRLNSGSFLRHSTGRSANSRSSVNNRQASHGGGPVIVAGPVAVPSRGVSISLEELKHQIQPSGSIRTSLNQQRITLVIHDSAGSLKLRVPILNRIAPIVSGLQSHASRLLIVNDVAFVVVGDRILQWSTAALKKPDTEEKVVPIEFHVVPRQSTFVVEGASTELKHTLKGGREPYEYFMLTRLEGVKLDEATGVVTISREELMPEVTIAIKKYVAGTSDVGEAVQKLKSESLDLMQPALKLLGRKPDGVPIAVPVHFKAIDEDGNVAEMQYFVLLEISFSSLTSMLRDDSDGDE